MSSLELVSTVCVGFYLFYRWWAQPEEKERQVVLESNDSKGERACRRWLEEKFKVKFNKVRPLWNVNPKTGYLLELDCYNAEKRLAVEYNGAQHYRFVRAFHKKKSDFTDQVYRDMVKKRLCKEQGVELVVVPYTVPINEIPGYLAQRIR